MNIVEQKSGQAIRFMAVTPSTGQTLYGINLARAFEARYGFLESPKTVEGFDLRKGVTFRHGIFDGIVIDKTMIYNNGILAEGAITTTECFDFISDVIDWASKDAGITIELSANQPALYNSTLHVQSELDFQKHLKVSAKIAQLLTDKLVSYGADSAAFELTGLTFQPSVQTPFRVERLANSPPDSNIYFSTAPLTTLDHLEVLTAIEAAFRA